MGGRDGGLPVPQDFLTPLIVRQPTAWQPTIARRCNNSPASAYILRDLARMAGEWNAVGFSELFRTHARDVYRYALYLSGDPALADDIVSETFIRVWHARNRVDLTTVRGYLLTIARNLFVAERRHARRTTALDETTFDSRPGPERQADGQMKLQVVLSALQSLPEPDRSAVLLRAAEDMSYDEVAAVLGISAVSARVKVHRARLKLAEALRTGHPAGIEPEVSK